MTPLRLMAVLAHPDDESLGLGGTLARYAAEGVEVAVVTATPGDAGRFNGIRPGEPGHPGADALGRIREAELEEALAVLGVREHTQLGYPDGALDSVPPREAVARITARIRAFRPQVVITFAQDGAYGHPDHIAICQLTTAATIAAADAAYAAPGLDPALAPHAVSKLYYMAWPKAANDAYAEAFRKLTAMVDGVERVVDAWPEWMLSCVLDTHAHWEQVWRAVSCHRSQIGAYEKLAHLSPASHEALWGWQSFYRVFSTVNGGRTREHDLFEGLRPEAPRGGA